jgi:FkbM family methyltransferase
MAKNARARLAEIWLKTIRLYTYHTPVSKGKYRLFTLAMQCCRELPTAVEVPARDGRRLSVNLTTGMHTSVFFLGEYEKAITEIVVGLLRPGDVCLDVGANFGWYTTLFYKYAGPDGEVHAFEPTPPTFRELEKNYELMGRPANVRLNNLALGDEEGEIAINLFEGLSTGHASLSKQGRDDVVSYRTKMTTLDAYLAENSVGEVNFVKVDIEGAEMMFLNGAGRLFEQAKPPIWLMEMALQQTSNFGYRPNDLIEHLRARAAYDFYVVDERRAKLKKIENFAADDIGANVIALPRGIYEDRLNQAEWVI